MTRLRKIEFWNYSRNFPQASVLHKVSPDSGIIALWWSASECLKIWKEGLTPLIDFHDQGIIIIVFGKSVVARNGLAGYPTLKGFRLFLPEEQKNPSFPTYYPN